VGREVAASQVRTLRTLAAQTGLFGRAIGHAAGAPAGGYLSAFSGAWRLVFAQKPFGLYRPEVLVHELVRLEIFDALRGNSTFFAAHALTFTLVPHGRLMTSTRDPIPNPA
jgi:hypothetical protein